MQEIKLNEIKDDEVLIKVRAIGVNRIDIINVATSKDGHCPGLECSGIIEAVGRNVNSWKVGERVCAILDGGGYAEKVVVPEKFLLPLPDSIDLDDAAGLPYTSCILWLALFKMYDPNTHKKKRIWIHKGTSAISALAIQYAKYMGLEVITSTGSSDNFSICHRYGADSCVLGPIDITCVDVIFKKCKYSGVDYVLDNGTPNIFIHIFCCHPRGTIVILDSDESEYGDMSLNLISRTLKVFDLFRSKDLVYKADVIAELRTHLWPAILEQKVVPAIVYRFPAIEAQKALNLLKKYNRSGKIIVCMNFDEATSSHLKMD